MSATAKHLPKKSIQILTWLVLLSGVVMRLIVYLQNRNLLLDEANIARNLFERGFAGLARPLSYEQYAPPVFLWIEKLSVTSLGYSEYALRFFPLVASIAALFLAYRLFQHFTLFSAYWYPLLLLATAPFFLRYATEVKQYMPDMLIALSLLLLALRYDVSKTAPKKFFWIWTLAGSIAVWASMPALFVLAGVGLYYLIIALQDKNYKKLWLFIIAATIWGIQFLLYYFTVLKTQSESPYLQNFHRADFLLGKPHSRIEFILDFRVLMNLFRWYGNYIRDIYEPVMIFNAILFVIGLPALIIRHFRKSVLILTPLALLVIAAIFDKFPLVPRLIVFISPIVLLCIAYGLQQLMAIPFKPVKIIVLLTAIGFGISGTGIFLVYEPLKLEQLTEGLDYMQAHHIPGKDLSIYHSSVPAFLYYTQIHPQKAKYASVSNADMLKWSVDYEELGREMKEVWQIDRPVGFIFTNATEAEVIKRSTGLSKYLYITDSLYTYSVKAYICTVSNDK